MNRVIVMVAIVLLGCASVAIGQQDSTWGKWQWLIGDWVGEGSGVPGEAAGWFSFHTDLNGKILVRKNHAAYPASKDRPAFVHDDQMIVYCGSGGQPERAIYFDNEGHVINYAIAYSDTSIVLTSDAMNNAPVFRLTHTVLGQNGVTVTFAMSQDGKTFRTYAEGKGRKVK